MKNKFRVRRAVLPIATALALLTSIATVQGQPATTPGAASAGAAPARPVGPDTPTRPDSPRGSTPGAPDTQLAYSLQALDSRLQSLETLQEASVSLSQGVLDQVNLVLQISAGVFGIFFVAFSLRQVFADRRQDALNSKFQEASQASIEQVTGLIGTLDGLFKLQHTADEMNAALTALKVGQQNADEATAKADERAKEQLRLGALRLNERALELSLELNRENYKTGDNRKRIEKLAQDVRAWPNKEQLSANCRRILGLENVISGMLTEALEELDAAADISCAHHRSTSGIDLGLLYPKLDPKRVPASAGIEANISLYHQGIVSYNLGRHVEAAELFRKAIKYKPNDVQAMGYVPEALFLGRESSFPEVIHEFEETEKNILEFDDAETKDWKVSRNAHLAILRVKLGNCYFPGCSHEPYRKHEHLRLAQEHYLKACEYNESSYLAKFSLAQTLSLKAERNLPQAARAEARAMAMSMFREVFDTLRVRAGEVTEAKIQMTLYYMLAICSAEAGVPGTSPHPYLLNIYERKGQLPNVAGFRIFSPLSKNNLTFTELRAELEEFERRVSVANSQRPGRAPSAFATLS